VIRVTKSIDFALLLVSVCRSFLLEKSLTIKIVQMMMESLLRFANQFILSIVIGVAFVEKMAHTLWL
jgi:hypothetical protein